jgi:hypothetical protein
MSDVPAIILLVGKESKMTPAWKERYRIKRQLIITKKAGGCERCGFQPEDPCQLDLDHIDPMSKKTTQAGKRMSPSSMMSYSIDAIVEELSKCRVLCKNCHALHTHRTRDERLAMGLAA